MLLSKQLISTAALAILLLLAQAAYWPPYNMDDTRTALVMITATALLGLAVWQGWVSFNACILLPLFVYAVIRGVFSWVPGLTAVDLAQMIGLFGVIVLASNANIKPVLWAIVGAAGIQCFATYFLSIPWQMDLEQHLGAWGTVRHATRYGAILCCGLAAAIKLFKQKSKIEKGIAIVAAAIFFASIFHSWSNMAVAVAALLLCGWFAIEKKGKWLILVLAVIVALMVIFKPKGFEIDVVRHDLWLSVLRETGIYPVHPSLNSVVGFGVGGWQKLCGTIGHINTGHPHSVFAEILFNFGLVGVLCFVSALIMAVGFGNRSIRILFGLAAITICISINSLFNYSDMELMFGTWMGLAINENG